jgi:hypothetical protein
MSFLGLRALGRPNGRDTLAGSRLLDCALCAHGYSVPEDLALVNPLHVRCSAMHL